MDHILNNNKCCRFHSRHQTIRFHTGSLDNHNCTTYISGQRYYLHHSSSAPFRKFHSFTASSQVWHILVLAPQALHLHMCLFGSKKASSTIVPHPQNGHGLGCSFVTCFSFCFFRFVERTPCILTASFVNHLAKLMSYKFIYTDFTITHPLLLLFSYSAS